MKPKILDLGCGKKKRPGSIGVDHSSRHQADIIHDLNLFPYPFKDDEFDEIYLDNVLEHLDSPMLVMEEVHRICKPGGRVKVIAPYFRSLWAFIDPTHKNFFTVNSFGYFDPKHANCKQYEYTQARFSVERICFNETLTNRLFKRIVVGLANRYPDHYELYLGHIYPLDDITYFLVKV
jgi:predicted SAM-dependent methyltransferase